MDEEVDVTVTKSAPACRAGGSKHDLIGRRGFRITSVLVLVMVGLVVLGFVMESQTIAYLPETPVFTEGVCSPRALNVSEIEYHSGHRFYSMLKEMGQPEALTFRGAHMKLCDEKKRSKRKFRFCLPISGRKDTPFCTASDRMDLLSSSPGNVCYASVLHLLLVDVYYEMKATGSTPLIVFGSLLGAVRNGSMIPFTEDTDIGYVDSLRSKKVLQEALWKKGYHMFPYGIWRVCVAPTHPLASRLYDPSLPLTKKYSVPYVDLYKLKKNRSTTNWEVQGLKGNLMAEEKIKPFSQVTINGMPFDTVHDPHFFLTEMYGSTYMTPIPRTKASNKTETLPSNKTETL